jgi:hypothetical protein
MQMAYTAAGGLQGLPNLLLLGEQFATRYIKGEESNLTINVPDQVHEEEDGEGFITPTDPIPTTFICPGAPEKVTTYAQKRKRSAPLTQMLLKTIQTHSILVKHCSTTWAPKCCI